jgi:gas vesicle protein
MDRLFEILLSTVYNTLLWIEVRIGEAMNKLVSLLIGVGIGAALGAALVLLFSPVSGDQLVKNLKAGYAETLEEARDASETRRKQLEAELKTRRGTPVRAIQKTG